LTGQPSATFAAATTGILVGAAMVSTRVVATDASPATLAFLRYSIGLLVLAVPVLLGARIRFALRDAAAIGLLGVFQFAILIVLLNYALETLPAATCALVFSTMPLFTMGMAFLTRREAYSRVRLAGVLFAVAGVGLLLQSAASPTGAERGAPWAFAALVAATLVGALCSLIYRPYLKRYHTLPTSALAMCAAVLFLGGLCWETGEPIAPELSPVQWANVGFIGLSSGLGYFCWLFALARIDASRVVAFQTLGPVTAATIELAMARALPTPELLFSMTLVVAGLLLALRPKPVIGGGIVRP
jgi:drug/metabolite transporter (DMT)-like permease